mgnify:FL=1|tara:strand:- start:15154 stop:15582 length:429 start_codon:yes stop_codon:yes gene_type:complete
MESKDKNNSRRDARRKALITLSVKAREMRDEVEELADSTLNDIIISHFYTDEENFDFKLLRDWNKEGFQVKKGARAFTVWGKKRKGTKAAEQEGGEDQEYKFFPLAYLFSNAQVERKEAKAQRPQDRPKAREMAAELSQGDF